MNCPIYSNTTLNDSLVNHPGLELGKGCQSHGGTKAELEWHMSRDHLLKVDGFYISLQSVHRKNIIPSGSSPLQTTSATL